MARIIVSILLILAGVAAMFMIKGLAGAFIGSMIFVAALFLWTIPWAGLKRDKQALDPMQRRISSTLLGVGLGMIGGLAAALLLPPPYFWIVAGAVTVAVIVWWVRN
jgi:hypothetical protein